MKSILLIVILPFLVSLNAIDGAHILLYPYERGFSSRLMDMKKIARELLERDYKVTILINSEDKKYLEDLQGLEFYEYLPPTDVLRLTDPEFMQLLFHNSEQQTAIYDVIYAMVQQELAYCEQLFQNRHVTEKIRAQSFDLLIVDLLPNCGKVLTQYLDIPTIAFNSVGFINGIEYFPNLPSFVGMSTQGFSNEMNFRERFMNTIMYVAAYFFITNVWYEGFNNMKTKYGINNPLPIELTHVDKIILAVCDYSLESPRPLLPNIICIGGFNHEPVQPVLQEPFHEIINNAQHGVILVSFGTLLPEMAKKKFKIIHDALKELPQSVIWRYKGDIPENISENIHIVDWMPQHDLLGSGNVKLFVTHSGSHSAYETAAHGVPVVSVPITADQYDMAIKLTERAKMGIKIDFNTMTSEILKNAITEVLTNTTYKENALKTAKLFADKPISPKEKFYFYVDYVIRNNGAPHLGMPAMKTFSTMQIYNIDVFCTMIGIVVAFIAITFLIILGTCKLLLNIIKKGAKIKKS